MPGGNSVAGNGFYAGMLGIACTTLFVGQGNPSGFTVAEQRGVAINHQASMN